LEVQRFLDVLGETLNLLSLTHNTQDTEKSTFYMSVAMSHSRQLNAASEEPAMYESYRAFRGLTEPPEGTLDSRAWRQDASREFVDILQLSHAKHLFVTSRGIVGLSRDEVQLGDLICRFEGVCRYWVLRAADPIASFRIVSITYIFPDDLSGIDIPLEVLTIS
jgi:hypothetical protein